MSEAIRPFTIDISDDVLTDLRARLHNSRWPDAEVVDDWSQGVPLAYVQDLCAYWADGYDWRSRERQLNRFDQFMTEIDGVDIHFIHQRSSNSDALPLVITHGWPGSVVEFHKVIEPLTEPQLHGGDAADAFHVVAPSLPGFGFSGKPTTAGWGIEKMADVWNVLMQRLGYDRYVAQGGDWGSGVTTCIGAQHPDQCAAIHVTLAMGARPTGEPSNDAERTALAKALDYNEWDSGYSTQQRTRPQTVGYGLHDSPSGQLAWIVEKFWKWMDCAGHPENVLHRDELLDNVMLYWATGSATSSGRIYWESFGKGPREVVHVPAGFGVYPEEIVPPVRSWVEPLFTDIVHWAEHDKGGHFAAFEVPDIFVDDIRTCFRQVR